MNPNENTPTVGFFKSSFQGFRLLTFMGFPNHCVGINGSVWSRLVSPRGCQIGTWHELKRKYKEERRTVYLDQDSSFSVCHLVLFAFVGPMPEGKECCHNDGNPRNNNLTNLRWDTHSENERDKVKHGTDNRGEKHPLTDISDSQISAMRKAYAEDPYLTYDDLAKRFSTNETAVCRIVTMKGWKHIKDKHERPVRRGPRGVKARTAKLTPEKVREIRRMFSQGHSQSKLAVLYGVDQTNISCIVRRKTWAFLSD